MYIAQEMLPFFLRKIVPFFCKYIRKPQDGIKWAFQVMWDNGEEFILGVIQFLKFLRIVSDFLFDLFFFGHLTGCSNSPDHFPVFSEDRGLVNVKNLMLSPDKARFFKFLSFIWL